MNNFFIFIYFHCETSSEHLEFFITWLTSVSVTQTVQPYLLQMQVKVKFQKLLLLFFFFSNNKHNTVSFVWDEIYGKAGVACR